MKHVFGILSAAALMGACSPHPPTAQATLPVTGSDKDAHGCIASAGYSWSPLRGECIRIFEVGLAFTPSDEGPKQTQQAFVVMPAQGASAPRQAELYLPGHSEPLLLQAVPVPEGETHPVVLQNEPAGVEIEYARDDYLLYIKGQLAFHRHGQDNTLLDALLAKR